MATSESARFDLLDRLAEDFAERYRRGERPSLQEYLAQYPDLADDIRELLPAMAEIEQVEEVRRQPVEPVGIAVPPLVQVGDYRILREIGRGGMGVVYEAEQRSLGRRVALKVLPLSASRDAQALERFRQEARSAARLHHTNIVPVFEVGQEGDTCYYAMQFIQGQGLDQIVEEIRHLRSASVAANVPEPAPANSPVPAVGQVQLVPAFQAAKSLLSGRFLQQPADTSPAHLADEPVAPNGLTQDHRSNRQASWDTERATLCPSTVTLLAGQAELSSVSNDYCHYFLSVARIGQQAAQALAYAHARGVIHRDIKPSNLILDAAGVVWVADFGLAKTEDAALTNTGDILGTLRYMSPERFRGEYDARADVYALGLTLYELLVLRPAFESTDRLRLIDLIKNQDPARPRSLDHRIPRDLETIVLKAIDKDPARRYQTADALAEDIRHFSNDEPIKARRPSLPERLVRWARHHRGVAALLAVIGLILVTVTVGSTLAAFGFQSVAQEKSHLAQEKGKLADEKEAERQEAIAARNREALLRKEAERLAEESRDRLVRLTVEKGVRLWHEGDTATALLWFTEALRLEQGNPDREAVHHLRQAALERQLRGLSHFWTYRLSAEAILSPDGTRVLVRHGGILKLFDAATGEELPDPRRPGFNTTSIRFSADSMRFLAHGHEGPSTYVAVWNTAERRRILRIELPAPVSDVVFSPDGRLLVTAGDDRTARVWSVGTGLKVGKPLVHADSVLCASFSQDGQRVVTGTKDGRVTVWDLATGKAQFSERQGAAVESVQFSPDGKWLATRRGTLLGNAIVYNAQTGARVITMSRCSAIGFSPDSRHFLTTHKEEHTVKVWETATGKPAYAPLQHNLEVHTTAVSPDGRLLATASRDRFTRIWDLSTGRLVGPPLQHEAACREVAFTSDGNRLMTICGNGKGHFSAVTVRGWQLGIGKPTVPLFAVQHGSQLTCIAFSPDGTRFATASRDSTARVWDTATGKPVTPPLKHKHWVQSVAFSPDGTRVLTASADGTARLWDARTGESVGETMSHSNSVVQAVFSYDGRFIATASTDHTARLWDSHDGKPITDALPHDGPLYAVGFSPDGRRLATGTGKSLQIWNVAAGKWEKTLYEEKLTAGRMVTFRNDGLNLLAACGTTARLWDLKSGKEVIPALQHAAAIQGAWFSPDGQRILTASWDNTARVWDATTGRPLTPAMEQRSRIEAAAFSPDGRLVATGGAEADGSVRLWDARTGHPITAPLTADGAFKIADLRFSPDGRYVLAGGTGETPSRSGSAWLWKVPEVSEQPPLQDLVMRAELLTGARIDSSVGMTPLDPETLNQHWQVLSKKYPKDYQINANSR